MKQILFDLIYDVYYDELTDKVFIYPPVKVYHLNLIRYELLQRGYKYKNIVIGNPDV